MSYIAEDDNDATAERNEGAHQFFYFSRGGTDQLPTTLDGRHLIRILKFTVERTISRHSPRLLSRCFGIVCYQAVGLTHSMRKPTAAVDWSLPCGYLPGGLFRGGIMVEGFMG